MRLLIIEGVAEKDKREHHGPDEVHRRCLECDSSFYLEYLSRTVAKCNNCGSTVTPMDTTRYFEKDIMFKVYGDGR